MAKDTQLEMDATELRLRAERRLGIMLTEQKQLAGLNRGGRPSKTPPEHGGVSPPSLKEIGIDYNMSSRAQKIGGIGEQAFEAMVDSMRQRIADGGRMSLDIASADKKERRAERERDLATKQTALPNKRYGVPN